jgi:formylglycine-generating enzyme required for sulfatase activity
MLGINYPVLVRNQVVPKRVTLFAALAALVVTVNGCRKPAPTPVSTAPPSTALPVVTNTIGMRLAHLPAGQFTTGARGTGNRTITLTRPFLMGLTEVTRAEFATVMKRPSPPSGTEDLPVVDVTWQDAKDFCDKLSTLDGKTYDLPTEAQWEYACQGGSFAPFDPAVADVGTIMWYNLNSGQRLHPVATRAPNRWGIFDMHGNVREWCRDWWSFTPPSGTDPFLATFTPHPASKTFGQLGAQLDSPERVRRGGAFDTPGEWCSCGYRDSGPPEIAQPWLGFRVVVELPADGGQAPDKKPADSH